ncbi:MAG TPA: metalloregulator ArsR/SmtB family transcription factor [Chitinophagales bacterium]|nr:metalloregulator ArsR/SmtB family transcription factor [Chitinophagales bacterium]
MAVNKKNEFSDKEVELAAFAKAVSHPARVAILKTLAQKDTCICGEIVEVLPLAQSTVSQHLKELLSAGLIKGTVEGPKSCYCINWEVFGRFEKTFAQFFTKTKSFEEKRNCC